MLRYIDKIVVPHSDTRPGTGHGCERGAGASAPPRAPAAARSHLSSLARGGGRAAGAGRAHSSGTHSFYAFYDVLPDLGLPLFLAIAQKIRLQIQYVPWP